MNYDSTTLSDMRRNKAANAVTSVISVLALQYATMQAAHAGDSQTKPKAPLEERLDKVPKMEPPKLDAYTPKTPDPFSVLDVQSNPAPVDGRYDEETRTFNGKVKVYGHEADISFIVGPKESDEHALSLKLDGESIKGLTINKAGENLYMDWENNVGAFAYTIDGKDFLIGFSYMETDDKTKIGESKRIDLVYQMFVLTDEDRVPGSVREKAAKGNFLLYVSSADGKAITCNAAHADMVIDAKRPDPSMYCGDVRFENNLSNLLAQQTDDVKAFAKDVDAEAHKMIKSGVVKADVIGYVKLMASEANRRLQLDMSAFKKRNPGMDLFSHETTGPLMAAMALLEDKLVNQIEDSYAETVAESPAPEPAPKPEPKQPDYAQTEKIDGQEVPVLVEPELPDEPKQPDVPKKPEVSLDVTVSDAQVHPAVDFKPKDAPKGDEDKDEDSFWTSPLAITLYVVAGVAVAGAVGTGVYFGTRDDGNGPTPQPPVGDPTMGPGDKW